MAFSAVLADGSRLDQNALDYVYVDVNTDEGVVPVEVAVTAPATEPDTWVVGEWVTGDTQVRVQVGPGSTVGALTPGKWKVWLRFPTNPELPTGDAHGFLFITDEG